MPFTPTPPAGASWKSRRDIFNLCIQKGVLVARGSWFRAEHDKPPTGLFFRTTFAAATPKDMTEAIRRFGGAIRESYRLA